MYDDYQLILISCPLALLLMYLSFSLSLSLPMWLSAQSDTMRCLKGLITPSQNYTMLASDKRTDGRTNIRKPPSTMWAGA